MKLTFQQEYDFNCFNVTLPKFQRTVIVSIDVCLCSSRDIEMKYSATARKCLIHFYRINQCYQNTYLTFKLLFRFKQCNLQCSSLFKEINEYLEYLQTFSQASGVLTLARGGEIGHAELV